MDTDKAGVLLEPPRPYAPAEGYKEERVPHIALPLQQQLVRYMYPLPLYVIRH